MLDSHVAGEPPARFPSAPAGPAAPARGTAPRWVVRACSDAGDLERLYRFRYAVYVEAKGLFRQAADHANRRLSDLSDGFGINFMAESGDAVIGSIRLNYFDRMVPTFCITEYEITRVGADVWTKGSVATRAIVHPDWRTSPVFADLALAAARRMMEDGRRWMFIDTSPGRQAGEEDRHLALYTAMGFTLWRPTGIIPGIGPGSVLLFDLERATADPRSLAAMYLRAAGDG